jgi:hypothetical protein
LPSQNLFIISFFFCMFDIVDVYRCLLCDRWRERPLTLFTVHFPLWYFAACETERKWDAEMNNSSSASFPYSPSVFCSWSLVTPMTFPLLEETKKKKVF